MDGPPKLDRRVVDHVAKLASLSLTDAEAERLTRELAAIVAYVAELDAIDTSGIEPTANVHAERAGGGASATAPGRADAPSPSLTNDDALAAAPAAADGGFAVPLFVEG